MIRLSAVLIFSILALGRVEAETLVTALSSSRVDIHSTYTGAVVTVFGTIERDARSVTRQGQPDLVVIVEGPPRNFVVRLKEKVGFAWLNTEQRRFIDRPSYLAILSTRPLEAITTPQLRRRFGLGFEAILSPPPGPDIDTMPDEKAFRDALIAAESRAGRFHAGPGEVAMLTPTLFRGAIPLPATAPVGTYRVTAKLIADGVQIAANETTFTVAKTGSEQRIAAAARDASFGYGLVAVAMAVLFGWIASVVFRRD